VMLLTVVNRIAVDIPQKQEVVKGAVQQGKNNAFTDVLKNEISKSADLKYSEHAKTRLRDRHIELSEADRLKIGLAVENAARKGAKDSLLLLNDLALLVSVKNRTVVTAIDQQAQSNKVFTNIDSAVIIR